MYLGNEEVKDKVFVEFERPTYRTPFIGYKTIDTDGEDLVRITHVKYDGQWQRFNHSQDPIYRIKFGMIIKEIGDENDLALYFIG